MSWTQCNLNELNRLKNFGDTCEKLKKKSENWFFNVKFDLVRGGARLRFIAKRLGRPSFFIKRSHLSNIRVKSEGVVATAWWVGVEWPLLLGALFQKIVHTDSMLKPKFALLSSLNESRKIHRSLPFSCLAPPPPSSLHRAAFMPFKLTLLSTAPEAGLVIPVHSDVSKLHWRLY